MSAHLDAALAVGGKRAFWRVPDRLRLWHVAAALWAAVFGAYFNSIDNGLVDFDDATTLSDSPDAMGSVAGLKKSLLAAAGEPADALPLLISQRPLTILTKAFDQAAFGEAYAWHRLVNIAWHLAAAWFAFLVAARLSGSRGFGLAASLVFALHPVQTESVAYLAGRRDVLSGALSLASIHFWLSASSTGRGPPLAASVGLWLLAMAAKPSAIAVPALWAAATALRRPDPLPGRKWLLAAAVAVCASFLTAHAVMEREGFEVRPELYWHGGTPLAQWATEPRVLIHALRLLVWPATLSADYSFQVFDASRSWLDARTILSVLALAAAAALAWRLRKTRPLAAFGLLWIGVAYAPMAHALPTPHNLEGFAEHWLYLPAFGFALLAASAARELSRRSRAAACCATGCVLLAYTARTVARNRDWKDAETLWSKTVQTAPRSARAHAVLALVYLRQGRLELAETENRKAIELGSRDPRTYLNQAIVYRAQGRLPEAERLFRQARLQPNAEPHLENIDFGLALLYYHWGRLDKAARMLDPRALIATGSRKRQGLELISARRLDLAGVIAAARGDAALAEQAHLAALGLEGDYPPARMNLAGLYLENGRAHLAVAWLREELSRAPSNLRARVLLGRSYLELGRLKRAQRTLRSATRLAPPSVEAWLALAEAETRAGDAAGALAAARGAAALEYSPRTRFQLDRARSLAAPRAAR
ncbi:MAG: tetratricopeptide repeat protein [Elusimicrobia bacterium]|nr:tetratricopeptide repeat protein [Elusimicrobiota bacterium]